MNNSGTWKSVERRIALLFGVKRTPLSGGNSGHTRSDTLHDKLFIEIKHRKGGFGVVNLFKQTVPLAKKENKIPVVAVHEKNRKDVFILCRVRDLKAVADCLEEIDDTEITD